MNRVSSGRSLVEILIVISILLLLAGMLVPVLGMIRDGARNVQCANNLRQLGMATLSFAQQRRGRLPCENRDWTPGSAFAPLPGAFRHDIWSNDEEAWPKQLWQCPTKPAWTESAPADNAWILNHTDTPYIPQPFPAAYRSDPNLPRLIFTSYIYAGIGSGWRSGNWVRDWSKIAMSTRDPAGTVLFADAAGNHVKAGRTARLQQVHLDGRTAAVENLPQLVAGRGGEPGAAFAQHGNGWGDYWWFPQVN